MPTGATSAGIRITDVIAHPLKQTLPKPTVTSWGTYTEVSIVLVEVRTDAGITGVGETLARFSPKAYAELIETSLKPRLVGSDPMDIQAHWLHHAARPVRPRRGHAVRGHRRRRYRACGTSWARSPACRSIACSAAWAGRRSPSTPHP